MRREEGFGIWFDSNAQNHKHIYGLFQLGWFYETPDRMKAVKNQIAYIHDNYPEMTVIFMANSPTEQKDFEALGERVIYCSQNAFLHEDQYPITNQKKSFDAIYLARLTPFKRHKLALKIPRLLLVGSTSGRDMCYSTGIEGRLRSDAVWIHETPQKNLYRTINQAKVGLALSDEDGPMYAATEYGLCGLPLLTTRCKGGRECSLSPEYVYTIPSDTPTEKDVLDGMVFLLDKKFDPQKVRQATIAVLEEHRQHYRSLIQQIFKESGQGTEKDIQHALDFPHKMGKRSSHSTSSIFTRSHYMTIPRSKH